MALLAGPAFLLDAPPRNEVVLAWLHLANLWLAIFYDRHVRVAGSLLRGDVKYYALHLRVPAFCTGCLLVWVVLHPQSSIFWGFGTKIAFCVWLFLAIACIRSRAQLGRPALRRAETEKVNRAN